jgi:hypothetical protein
MRQPNQKTPVIPAGKRVSRAMDGRFRIIHEAWISAIPAEMTIFLALAEDSC